MMVYVASANPLPESSWDKAKPGFYVQALPYRDEAVRRQFRLPFVYLLGSHQGCGCGFDWEGFEELDETYAECVAVRDSRRRLSEFLSLALRNQPEIELYACWNGDQGAEPLFRGQIRPVDLITSRTSFQDGEWLLVSEATERT
jgi:hypothetical protein